MTMNTDIQKYNLSPTSYITYLIKGSGYPTIILPGWLSFLDKLLPEETEDFQLIALHLSNFGLSSTSSKPMNIENYTEEIKTFLESMNITKCNLIAHSAGGRFAIHFMSKYPEMVNKLVLMSSAGIKHKRASSKMISRGNNYFAKFFVRDNEQEILNQTFKNIYNTYLTEEIKKINKPTLILWGAKDKVINVKKAYIFESLIPDSKLKVYDNFGHMLIKKKKVYQDIFEFLK